jgi:cell shape-determining protein MreC
MMSPRRERQSTQPVEDVTRVVEKALEREEVEVKNVEQRLKYRRAELREKRQLKSI